MPIITGGVGLDCKWFRCRYRQSGSGMASGMTDPDQKSGKNEAPDRHYALILGIIRPIFARKGMGYHDLAREPG